MDVGGRGTALARVLVQGALAWLAYDSRGVATAVDSVFVLAHYIWFLVVEWSCSV